MNAIASLMFGLALLWSGSVLATELEGAPPDTPQIILAAGLEGELPISGMLTLKSGHLLALGVGVVAGAVLIGPYLGISEVVGVGIGVISGEIFYRSDMWPLGKPQGWFR